MSARRMAMSNAERMKFSALVQQDLVTFIEQALNRAYEAGYQDGCRETLQEAAMVSHRGEAVLA